MNNPFIEKAGEEQAKEVDCNRGDSRLRWQILPIDMIDPPGLRVGMNELVRNLRDRRFHSRHYLLPNPQWQAKQVRLLCLLSLHLLVPFTPTAGIIRRSRDSVQSAGRTIRGIEVSPAFSLIGPGRWAHFIDQQSVIRHRGPATKLEEAVETLISGRTLRGTWASRQFDFPNPKHWFGFETTV